MRPPRAEAPTPTRRRSRVVGVILAAVAVLTGCTSLTDRSPTTHPALRDVDTFAFALGVELDAEALDRLGRYDLVVIDGDSTAGQVRALHDDGVLVLSYLSVGTLEPYRRWFAEAEQSGYLLDRFEDWDEWYAAVDQAGLRSILVTEAERELAQGFDGLFLDNADMVEQHPDQAAGMVRLVGELDALLGPDRVLFAQNGDASVDAIARHLDGWNREDLSATYDFDTDRYAAVPPAEAKAARATVTRLIGRGLLVTSTDYTPADGDRAGATAVVAACAVGAVPFVADIDLTRLPADPVRCP